MLNIHCESKTLHVLSQAISDPILMILGETFLMYFSWKWWFHFPSHLNNYMSPSSTVAFLLRYNEALFAVF